MNLIPIIARTLWSMLAGVGVTKILDKIGPDKLPYYPSDGVSPKDESGKINMPKIIWWVIAGVLGSLVWHFIAKKIKI